MRLALSVSKSTSKRDQCLPFQHRYLGGGPGQFLRRPISNATVTMNGVILPYNSTNQDYEGIVRQGQARASILGLLREMFASGAPPDQVREFARSDARFRPAGPGLVWEKR